MGEPAPASRRVHLCVRICAPESGLGVWLQLSTSPVLGFVLWGVGGGPTSSHPCFREPPSHVLQTRSRGSVPRDPDLTQAGQRGLLRPVTPRWQEQPEAPWGPTSPTVPPTLKRAETLLERQLVLFSGFYIFFPSFLFVVFCPPK